MATPQCYVPILKWKLGEQTALHNLFPGDHPFILPLFEVLPESVDDDDLTASPPVDAYGRVGGKILRRWSSHVFVDLPDDPAQPTGPTHPVARFFDAARTTGALAIPVTDPARSAPFQQAVASVHAADQRGACVRLDADTALSASMGTQLTTLLQTLNLPASQVDLVLDWGAIGVGHASRTVPSVQAGMQNIPTLAQWRSVTFAASAFPQLLTSVGVGLGLIFRAEWDIYKRLMNTPGLPRSLAFGDYCIAYPVYETVPFMGSANIRYTLDDEWLILRGNTLKGPVYGGFSQYQGLCSTLVVDPRYRGRAFSWGDDYIHQCAAGVVSTGNATTWRGVGTNHHLTLAGRQVSSWTAPSTGAVPARVGP